MKPDLDDDEKWEWPSASTDFGSVSKSQTVNIELYCSTWIGGVMGIGCFHMIVHMLLCHTSMIFTLHLLYSLNMTSCKFFVFKLKGCCFDIINKIKHKLSMVRDMLKKKHTFGSHSKHGRWCISSAQNDGFEEDNSKILKSMNKAFHRSFETLMQFNVRSLT